MYTIISPPFTLKFTSMSKEDLSAYYSWVMNNKSERLSILAETVSSTPGYSSWKNDFTRDSLLVLGRWFYENIEVTKRSVLDRLKAKLVLKNNVTIENLKLTNKTYSLAFDVGLYLASVFIKEHPQLQWIHNIHTRKDDADYGQPVLNGFGKLVFNPIRKMVITAYAFVKKSKTPSSILELYSLWESYIS